MNKIDLSIVIVAYNSEDVIRDCVESILDSIKKNSFEIKIIDNSPNEKTRNILEKLALRHHQVSFEKSIKNLGFARGNNKAVKKTSGRYVLFLNPDTIVYKDTLDGMVAFMDDNKDAGAATCFMELLNKTLDDASHRGFPTPWRSLSYFLGLSKIFPKVRFFGGYNLTYLNLKKTHEIDALSGSFMIVPRGVGEELKWWDEDYFFYGEDIDFCYRIKNLGLKIYFVPKYRSLHYKGVSSGIKKQSKEITKATKDIRSFVTDARFEAMKIFYKKHYEEKYPSILTSAVMLGIAIKRQIAKRQI